MRDRYCSLGSAAHNEYVGDSFSVFTANVAFLKIENRSLVIRSLKFNLLILSAFDLLLLFFIIIKKVKQQAKIRSAE